MSYTIFICKNYLLAFSALIFVAPNTCSSCSASNKTQFKTLEMCLPPNGKAANTYIFALLLYILNILYNLENFPNATFAVNLPSAEGKFQ